MNDEYDRYVALALEIDPFLHNVPLYGSRVGEAHNYRDFKPTSMASLTHKRLQPDSDEDEIDAYFL